MYIQITTRCNMECDHCGMSCTADGEDMSLETFRLGLVECYEFVTIGGGEPTVHPLFWQMLCEAIGKGSVWLATNGKIKNTALVLAKMVKAGVINCDLSQDNYHDQIDDEVVDVFTQMKRIRNVTGNEISAGRCDWGKKGCICEDFVLKPNGDVMACGCEDAPCFGNVHTNWEVPEWWEWGECHKGQNDF